MTQPPTSPRTLQDWLSVHPQVASLRAAVYDLNGCLRGKRLLPAALSGVERSGLGLPLSASVQDIWGRDVWDNPMMRAGDPDGQGRWTGRAPLLMDWLAAPSALVPLQMYDVGGAPSFADGRTVLSRVLADYNARSLTPVVATELEFYLLDASHPQPRRVAPGGRVLTAEGVLSIDDLDRCEAVLADLYRAAGPAALSLGAAISEGGAGQFEVNFAHTGDALAMADDTMMLKHLVKGIARRHGMTASFMAKPFLDMAGSGMHVHLSILDGAGSNLFDDRRADGAARLGHAVAGLLAAAPGTGLILAPHLNSYRRLEEGSHAPTTLTWAEDNRLAAVRIPAARGAARRLEHRMAGADANPYLVLAVVLGTALKGLEARQDPPPATTGNAYESDAPAVPRRWGAAIDRFGDGLDGILDPDLIRVFRAQKMQERDRFAAEITDYEYATYLECV